MTVIYSDFGDKDTKVLKNIWKDLDAKVIHLTSKSNVTSYEIDKAIDDEKDTIIFCGHGDGFGCWSPCTLLGDTTPNVYHINYTVSPRNKHLLKGKKVIGIWCYASDFAKDYKVEGFFSYMFISNPREARYLGISEPSYERITRSEVKFCDMVNTFLKDDIPLQDWKGIISANTDKNFDVEKFNYGNAEYVKF